MKKSKYTEYIINLLPCLCFGALCGSLTGVVIFLFRLAAKHIEELSVFLYGKAVASPLGCIVAVSVCILSGTVMYFLHKKMPEIKGGGIPRSEGILRGLLPFRQIRTFLGTIVGSFISFFCGVPVGSEGPAVLIGTCIGGMCSSIYKNKYAIDRYVMTGGAGAGFAVATGAPLSAMLFALEEIHKRFTPMLVMNVSVSVIFATTVNRILCNKFSVNPNLFSIRTYTGFELKHLGFLVLLGVLTALAVGLFDKSIHLFKRFSKFSKDVMHPLLKLIILFTLTGFMGLFLNAGIYSGHNIIESVHEHQISVFFLVAILAIRMFMMLFITDCGATGGIFIPTLAIGALFSAIFSRILCCMGLNEQLGCAVTLLGMCAFLGGTLRAPFTACLLFAELTGSFTAFFYVAVTVFTVNLVTELLGQLPFYDMVLEHTVRKQNKNLEFHTSYLEMTVSENSFVCGKTVRDIMWPYFCVVLSVKHKTEPKHNDSFFNDGEKKLSAGDIIKVRVRYTDKDRVLERLYALAGNKDLKETDTE